VEGGFESLQDGKSLLADSGDVSPDAGEGERTGEAAESARDPLLHLDHAKVPLCNVVVEVYPEVVLGG